MLFDTATSKVIMRLNGHHASSEVLKFSPDGQFLITRLNDEQHLAVIDASELIVLQTFPHNFHCFPYNYHTVYQMFPLLSNCATKMAVLEWNETSAEPDVYTFDLPRTMLTLKKLARITILGTLKCSHHIDSLPLPRTLKVFLQWQQL